MYFCGYGLVCNDRRHKEGGGVLINVRTFKMVYHSNEDVTLNATSWKCVLKSGSQTNPYLILFTLYRPPDDDSLIHEWLTSVYGRTP